MRIIAGKWRGRRLAVPDLPGLRPTGDRCRETLFNWLQPFLAKARCADLFAGTGALGLEAASRGAAHVVLVESEPRAVRALRESISVLGADRVDVIRGDARKWLGAQPPRSLDIVFIDPPFAGGLVAGILALLADRECLAAGGLAYVETQRDQTAATGSDWETVKDKVVGDVRMRLLKKSSAVESN